MASPPSYFGQPPYAQLPLSPSPSVHSAELRAGFAERDITPEIPDSWADLDGNAQFDPDIDSWVDGNGNGEFDAVWMAGFQNNRPAQGVELPRKPSPRCSTTANSAWLLSPPTPLGSCAPSLKISGPTSLKNWDWIM